MQMFVLDHDPKKSAEYLCDAHVRVICREITMLLSNWYYWNLPESRKLVPYRPMNKNQPLSLQFSSIPVRRWACSNAGSIFKEFRERFHKEHASEQKLLQLLDMIALFDSGYNIGYKHVSFTYVGKDEGIGTGYSLSQVILLYRKYYLKKSQIMRVPFCYIGRLPPSWLKS